MCAGTRACTRQAGRDELAAAEKSELVVINSFLPALADEATTRKWVEEAIAESGATSPAMMGKVCALCVRSLGCVWPFLFLLPRSLPPLSMVPAPNTGPSLVMGGHIYVLL